MGDMLVVGENELQRVLALRQLQLHLGLAGAEMDVIGIVRERRVERRSLGVDDEVVMAGIGFCHARRRDAHIAQAETDG